jgi:type II secretory pathway pseudopilin PulG
MRRRLNQPVQCGHVEGTGLSNYKLQITNYKSCHRRRQQHGYIMLALVLLVALVLIALAAELPNLSTQLRRDREEELIHRGAQYARAIKKYYRKFGTYPVSIEQLENTNHLRFLRKRYKDPMTGKDFRLLHLGEVQLSLKAPGMTTGPGVAPGSPLQSGSGFGQPAGGGQQPQPSAGGSQPSSPFVSPTAMGAKGPTFGGGPIIGVASTYEKQSLHVFNKKDHYNQWEFIYDPTSDRGGLIKGPYNGTPAFGGGQIPGAVTPAQMQPGAAGASPFGTSPFGSGTSNQPFGSGGMSNSPFNQPNSPLNQPQQPPR